MLVLCNAIVALLAFQFPPPPSQPCYTFSDTPMACGGCADVNNCGNCWSGACNAAQAQKCNAGRVAILTEGSGNLRNRATTHCFYKLDCLPPVGCDGPCTLGTTPFGFSEDTTLIDDPGAPCGSPPT